MSNERKSYMYPTCVALALICALICYGLCISWSAVVDDIYYVGVPSWNSNVFAYHPTLMVGGFFIAQVLAINSWILSYMGFPAIVGKVAHITFQIGALVTMIVGLVAVVKFMEKELENSSSKFTSLHAWVGVSSISVYVYNFCFALVREWFKRSQYFTTHYPSLPVVLLQCHKFNGIAALLLTVVAIVTGIADQQLPCTFDSNASYAQLSQGCQISYGLGLMCVITSAFVVASIAFKETPLIILAVNNSNDAIPHSAPDSTHLSLNPPRHSPTKARGQRVDNFDEQSVSNDSNSNRNTNNNRNSNDELFRRRVHANQAMMRNNLTGVVDCKYLSDDDDDNDDEEESKLNEPPTHPVQAKQRLVLHTADDGYNSNDSIDDDDESNALWMSAYGVNEATTRQNIRRFEECEEVGLIEPYEPLHRHTHTYTRSHYCGQLCWTPTCTSLGERFCSSSSQ